MSLSILGKLHQLLWVATYVALIGVVILTISESSWALWAITLWFTLTVLRATMNLLAGIKAGAVFRFGSAVGRQTDPIYFTFMFRLSAFLVSVGVFLGLFIAGYKLLT